ncbi:MAG: hypothetical protein ACP5E3_07985 [Bacteroidales bacterium]
MRKGKVLFKIWLIVSLIGLVIILFWFINIIPTAEEDIHMAVNAYKIDEFNGVVIDKYIDKNEHNFKKVIINENNTRRVVLFDIEISGVYDFFMVGDSIAKDKGNLQIRVIRNDLDTTLQMEFVKPAK